MALSMSEQRRLAEIEKHLSAEDPRLARMIADWSAGPSGPHVVKVAAGVVVSVAALLAGVALIGGKAGTILIVLGMFAVFGVLCLLAALRVRLRWPRTGRRRVGKPNAETQDVPRTAPYAERWYLWIPWYWWG